MICKKKCFVLLHCCMSIVTLLQWSRGELLKDSNNMPIEVKNIYLICSKLYLYHYNTFALRMHAEVDNEDHSTICLSKCMGLCIIFITKNLHNGF